MDTEPDHRSRDGSDCQNCGSYILCNDVIIYEGNQKGTRKFARVCCANKDQCFDVECQNDTSKEEIEAIKGKHEKRRRLIDCALCGKVECNQRCSWKACRRCCEKFCDDNKALCGGHSKYDKLEVEGVFMVPPGMGGPHKRSIWKGKEPLASGSYAVVHPGRWGLSRVAIKCFKDKEQLGIDNIRERINSEITVWATLQHENIVPLYATVLDSNGLLALVTPLHKNGNLESFLGKEASRGINRWQLLIDVAHGLAYLHDSKKYHGDITLNNILVTDEGRAVLTDFGLSRMCEQTGYSTLDGGRGCPQYRAYESFVGELSGDPEARACRDVWAFAIVVVEVITGIKPYDGCSEVVDIWSYLSIGKRPYGPAQLNGLPRPIPEMLWRSWDMDPSKRPKITEVVLCLAGAASNVGSRVTPGLQPGL